MIKHEADSFIGADGSGIRDYIASEVGRLRNTQGLLLSSNKHTGLGGKPGDKGFYFGPKPGQEPGARASWPMTDDESSVLGLHSTLSDASASEAAVFGTNSTSTRQWFDGSILDEFEDESSAGDIEGGRLFGKSDSTDESSFGGLGGGPEVSGTGSARSFMGSMTDKDATSSGSSVPKIRDAGHGVREYMSQVDEEFSESLESILSDPEATSASVLESVKKLVGKTERATRWGQIEMVTLGGDDSSLTGTSGGESSGTESSSAGDGLYGEPSHGPLGLPDPPGSTRGGTKGGEGTKGGTIEMTDASGWTKGGDDSSGPSLEDSEDDDLLVDPEAGSDGGAPRYDDEDAANEKVGEVGDEPSPSELSKPMPPEARAALNDAIAAAKKAGLSDEALLSEMGMKIGGAGARGGLWITRVTLTEYLKKQAKGLLLAPVLIPLTMWLNNQHEHLGDTINCGLAILDLIGSGDPLALLVTAGVQLWEAGAESRQRVMDNDEPDKAYGSRMGYVREGDKWYPAIYNSRYKSTGLLANDSSMILDYGHEVVWGINGEGDWIPMIPNAKSKSFVALGQEWDMKSKYGKGDKGPIVGTKDFITGSLSGHDIKTGDVTRDWYFLDKDESAAFAKGGELTAYTDDITKMNPAVRQVNDWRKALDFGQDWKWSSAVKTMGRQAQINNYMGSRGLQRVMMEAADATDAGFTFSKTEDYDTYIRNVATGTGKDANFHPVSNTFKDYLYQHVLHDHMQALYKTQMMAAKEAGFDELYMNSASKTAASHNADATDTSIWAAMYLDTGKDMPTASTSDDLKQQLHDIEMLNDRTPKQRNYLAQKVQTRYWIQQFVQMGQSTEVMHYLLGRDWNNGDPYENRKYTSVAASQFAQYSGATTDQYSAWYNHLDKMPGFAMPWQNGGENILPTVTGVLSDFTTDPSTLMDDFRKTAYDRMSKEAAANTTAWINATSGINPNAKLDGRTDVLHSGGVLDKLPAAAPKKVTFADDPPPKKEEEVPKKEEEVPPKKEESAMDKFLKDPKHSTTGFKDKDDKKPGGDFFKESSEDHIVPRQTFGQKYPLPDGWKYLPPTLSSDGRVIGSAIYVAPDGTFFKDDGTGVPRAIDHRVHIDMNQYAAIIAETLQDPEYLAAMARKRAELGDLKKARGDKGRGTGGIKGSEKFRKTKVTPTIPRPTAPQSHGPDTVVATTGVSVAQGHSVDNEHYDFHMTETFASAIRAAESQGAEHGAVKVI